MSLAAVRAELAELRGLVRCFERSSDARLRLVRLVKSDGPAERKAILSAATVERRLEELLRAEEPRLARWLVREWKAQRADITDAELLAAVRAGELPLSTIGRLRERYAEFVNTRMVESWAEAAGVSSEMWKRGIRRSGVEHDFDFLGSRISEWTGQHAAELVTHMTEQQQQAIRNVILHHVSGEPLAERSLVQLLRPLVGLTPRQAMSVAALRQRLADEGVVERRINEQVAKYALRTQRRRAQTIARTELAMAYNNAADLAVRDAVEAGAFENELVKVWRTQKDERVCRVCGPRHEQRVGLNGDFGGVALPPAHPRCRCVLLYE